MPNATALILALFSVVCAQGARAGDLEFAKMVKASVLFRESRDPKAYYPHLLHVFLRIENIHDAAVNWYADVDAQVLDGSGRAVPEAAGLVSGTSNADLEYIRLPYGSSIDWRVSSDGGKSFFADQARSYEIIVGSHAWLVPIKTAGSYSLRIRLRGMPWVSPERLEAVRQEKRLDELLLELSPAKIIVSR